jgi:dolichyl-phosphate beta-glucosyltransferase
VTHSEVGRFTEVVRHPLRDHAARAIRPAVARARRREPIYLSVIVPVWNGAEQLAHTLNMLHERLGELPYTSELIVVDDCSDDAAVRIMTAFVEAIGRGAPRVRLLRNDTNCGKGFSVRRGMLAAGGALRVFIDSDLAYPPTEIDAIVGALEDGNEVALACRALPESRYVMSPSFLPYLFTRHVMGRAYNALVRRLLVRSVLDTQAGLKGFTREAAEQIFSRLTIHRFGFDVECLYIAQRQGRRLMQVPVTFRYRDEPSSVRLLRDGARMFTDLARILMNARRGRYD